MNLSFLNPLFLFGLAAAALPILIHRLTRRKAITKRFSAVRLLIRSQQVMSKPQRIKHLLLLALRVLTVITLVFLMARPLLTEPGFLHVREDAPTLVILDNSMSMGYREDQGTRYDIAKKAAREIIGRLKGEVLLLPTSSPHLEDRWMSREEALQELERKPLAINRGDPITALNLGNRLLNESKKPGAILIITDMVRGDWEGFDLSQLGTISSETKVNFLRIGSPDRDSNVAVNRLNLIEGEAVAGVPARLEVVLSNFSEGTKDVLVQLYLSDVKKDQKSLTLKAREEGMVYFDLFLDRPGRIVGLVRISGDRLPFDDVLPFSMNVREKVNVLVVDGDPRTSLKAGESYYVANALQPGGSESTPFHAKVITEEEFPTVDLKPFEALFLLNVARPHISKLLSFLESGKPVFLFLGDRVFPEDYNAFPLSPWRIREVQDAEGLRVSDIHKGRPILRSISETGWESLRTASFHRYYKTEGGATNLLTFKNRDPLLIETGWGKGKIFLFTSSADLDWNDLPVKAVFLPLIQGLLKEATGLTENQVIPNLNRPSEESDLSKLSPDEMKQRFGMIDTKVVEYNEEVLKAMDSGRKELWPLLLSFVLFLLALEMVVAGRT